MESQTPLYFYEVNAVSKSSVSLEAPVPYISICYLLSLKGDRNE